MIGESLHKRQSIGSRFAIELLVVSACCVGDGGAGRSTESDMWTVCWTCGCRAAGGRALRWAEVQPVRSRTAEQAGGTPVLANAESLFGAALSRRRTWCTTCSCGACSQALAGS
jgi:hypothetical protein